MRSGKKQQSISNKDVWIINRGRHTKLDLSKVCKGIKTTLVKEYRISDLTKYLLNPNPLEVKKILIGCEVYYKQSLADRVRERLRLMLPIGWRRLFRGNKFFSEVIMANRETDCILLEDRALRSHLKKIRTALRTYNPVLKRLSRLDYNEISNVVGLCEDIGGNRSLLNLKGDAKEKIDYVMSFILKDVGVILEKAYVAEGLFEMSGFDSNYYDSSNSHRLIKFYLNGKPKCCVIGFDGKVEYWVDDVNLVNHMQLLEYSIKANPRLNNCLGLCTNGEAKPLRLLFKKPLEIDYSRSPLPPLYRNVFETYNIGSNEKDILLESLKNSQLGILFNYVPFSTSGKQKLFTNVSVMHDVRALEPIKDRLPELYSIIDRMASVTEAGKYYLLDSIKGYSNEYRLQ